MSSSTWVFGYGSLVSPASLATTIERTVGSNDVAVAHLHGFARRWNYGSLSVRGEWHHAGVNVTDGCMVALGLVVAEAATCNGVIVRVTPTELALLDRRERDYDRTDVTDMLRREDGEPVERVVTYVPRPSAIARYEQARDLGRAAIRRSYWELVEQAFDDLGGDHRALYDTTPAPDVPVVDMTLSIRS